MPTNRISSTLLVCFVMFLTASARAQLRIIYPGQATAYSHDAVGSFYSPTSGFVAFEDYIAFTADSGYTFSPRPLDFGNLDYSTYGSVGCCWEPRGVKAFSANNIVAWGAFNGRPAIVTSANGGQTYKLVYYGLLLYPGPLLGIRDLLFPSDGNIGYALSDDHIVKTFNKGASWSTIYTSSPALYNKLVSVDDNTVYAASIDQADPRLIRTTDGGSTWSVINLPGSARGNFTALDFITATIGWVCTDGITYKTTDGGATWTALQGAVYAKRLFSMKFLNLSHGFAVADEDSLFTTNTGGATWEPVVQDDHAAGGNMLYYNNNQFWSFGSHTTRVSLITNAQTAPVRPRGFFNIDTTDFIQTGGVSLSSVSNQAYSLEWFVNGVSSGTLPFIAYTHNRARLADTITLVVTYRGETSSSTQIQMFDAPIAIKRFSPTAAKTNDEIRIVGKGFSSVTNVWLGGIASPFQILSDSIIIAVVRTGATGNIQIFGAGGNAEIGGFEYVPPFNRNINASWVKNLLCKEERAALRFTTEPATEYWLKDSLGNNLGYTVGDGNIKTLITDGPRSVSATYYLYASRMRVEMYGYLDTSFLYVEHPRAGFTATPINALPGEQIQFNNNSNETSSVSWVFNQDASIKTSSAQFISNMNYPTEGTKTLVMVATSPTGCADTLSSHAVTVVNGGPPDETCYLMPVPANGTPGYARARTQGTTPDNGYFYGGYVVEGSAPSRYGASPSLPQIGGSFIGRYTENGMLRWMTQLKMNGMFGSSVQDAAGNVYISGYTSYKAYLTLPNGDSLAVGDPTTISNDEYPDHQNGFIVKLDPAGKYIWHTTFHNGFIPYSGGTMDGARPMTLIINNNRLVVSGGNTGRMIMVKNNVSTDVFAGLNPDIANESRWSFVLALSLEGNLLWKSAMNHVLAEGPSIKGDAAGNTYLAYSCDYGTSVIDNANTRIDLGCLALIVKLDANGNKQWIHQLNAIQGPTFSLNDMAIDAATSDVYVTGGTSMNQPDDQIIFTDPDGTVHGQFFSGMFTIKLNTSGKFQWAAGTILVNRAGGSALMLKNNFLYVAGTAVLYPEYPGEFAFLQPDSSRFHFDVNSDAPFIAKYTRDGQLVQIYPSSKPGERSDILLTQLEADRDGNFLFFGETNVSGNGTGSTIHFFGLEYEGDYSAELIVAKLNPELCMAAGALPSANAGPDKSVCNSGEIPIGTPAASGLVYSWTNSEHHYISSEAQPVVSPTASTYYYLAVMNAEGLISRDTMYVSTTGSAVDATAGDDRAICEGTTTTIGSTAQAGLVYSWTSMPEGFTSSDSQPVVTPGINTTYFLQVANGAGCGGYDTVFVKVDGPHQMAAYISSFGTEICQGDSIHFVADVADAGPVVNYNWLINGMPTGVTTKEYMAKSVKDKDRVSAEVQSTGICLVDSVVRSEEIVVIVHPKVLPQISIAGNTDVPEFGETTLSATVTNEGDNPVLQWQDSTASHGWQAIGGQDADQYVYSHTEATWLRCRITTTGLCTGVTQAYSNILAFELVAQAVNPVLYPNPATTSLTIDSLDVSWTSVVIEIYSSGSMTVIRYPVAPGSRSATIDITGLMPGQYFIGVVADGRPQRRLRFLKL